MRSDVAATTPRAEPTPRAGSLQAAQQRGGATTTIAAAVVVGHAPGASCCSKRGLVVEHRLVNARCELGSTRASAKLSLN